MVIQWKLLLNIDKKQLNKLKKKNFLHLNGLQLQEIKKSGDNKLNKYSKKKN